MTKEKIIEIVINQVKSLVDTLPDGQKFDVTRETVLYGENSNVDSLSLVSIIVDLETVFGSEYGLEISLSDDRAMSSPVSPFNSVQNMADYIYELVKSK